LTAETHSLFGRYYLVRFEQRQDHPRVFEMRLLSVQGNRLNVGFHSLFTNSPSFQK
jgi:hypothetical protein